MSAANTRQTHRLIGLDGQNPLGLFAALGTLRVLDELARASGAQAPRLRFVDEGRQVAELETEHDAERVIELLLEDARSDRGRAALGLSYDENGEPCASNAPKARRDLKPSPSYAASYLREVALHWKQDRRAADLAHAFLSELVQDNNGSSKPTSFHFAAGQQQWLTMVLELREKLGADDLREALFGPWQEREAPSLAWDSSVARDYALRATNPSKEKRGSIPGANWLGVLGLTFFPVEAKGSRLVTTRVTGGWKDSSLIWPVWSRWTTRAVAEALLRGDPTKLDRDERARLGITQVFACRILRSDQGGYGTFAPADVVAAR